MTKEYDNTNKGIAFVNDKKESEKHPDFKGSLNVDGKEFWISGWKKFTKSGEGISLAVTPKEKPKAPPVNQDSDGPPW